MATLRDPNGPDGCSQTPPWLSLRDHFAGLAMQGMLANDESMRKEGVSRDLLTHAAYAIADAMLSARGKGEE